MRGYLSGTFQYLSILDRWCSIAQNNEECRLPGNFRGESNFIAQGVVNVCIPLRNPIKICFCYNLDMRGSCDNFFRKKIPTKLKFGKETT